MNIIKLLKKMTKRISIGTESDIGLKEEEFSPEWKQRSKKKRSRLKFSFRVIFRW